MSVVSTSFVVAVLIVAAVIFFLPRGLARQTLLAGCNAAFLALCVSGWPSWVALAAFILSGYYAGEVVRNIGDSVKRSRTITVYITLLVIVFIVLKEYQFLNFIIPSGTVSRWVSIVGLSYMLFRQIHYVVDISEGQIERSTLWAYLNYQLNLFTLYAGPIQRFQHFSESWDLLAPKLVDNHNRLKALARLSIGVLKVALFGVLALHISQQGSEQQISSRSASGLIRFAMLFYGYPVYMYFNFSGYCDVVIAAAALVGIILPENFDMPYIARNAIDYWTRWHMTLTHWIRDYVFTPTYKAGVERSFMQPQRWGYVCYLIALVLSGLWHGTTWNYALWGLLHGIGIVAAKMWETHIIRRRGRPGLRKYLASTKIRVAATVLTLHFVCFTFLFFPPDLKGRLIFLKNFVAGRPVATI